MIFIMNKRDIKMDFPSKMREKNSRFGGEIGYFFATNAEGEPRFMGWALK